MAEPMKLSPKDVLSVLGEFERDISAREQQRAGIRHVREVMQTFQEIEAKTKAAQAELMEVQGKLTTVKTQYDGEKMKAKQARDTECAACATEAADAKKAADTVKKRYVDLEKDLAEKERFATERSAQLDAELKEKSAKLAKVQADFDAILKKHAIGA